MKSSQGARLPTQEGSFCPCVIPSAARNLIALPALGSTPHAPTPRVILSVAKNPGKEAPSTKGFFAALRMTQGQNDTGQGCRRKVLGIAASLSEGATMRGGRC